MATSPSNMPTMNVNSREGINYSDLQLPRTSNNGSMKKNSRGIPHHHHHHQHMQYNVQQQSPPHHHGGPSPMPRNLPPPSIPKTDYAHLQFKPKSSEQAEV